MDSMGVRKEKTLLESLLEGIAPRQSSLNKLTQPKHKAAHCRAGASPWHGLARWADERMIFLSTRARGGSGKPTYYRENGYLPIYDSLPLLTLVIKALVFVRTTAGAIVGTCASSMQ